MKYILEQNAIKDDILCKKFSHFFYIKFRKDQNEGDKRPGSLFLKKHAQANREDQKEN